MDTPTLYVRKARREDIDTTYKWRHETAAWLAEKYGTDQWSTDYPREKLEHWVDRGENYMVSLEPDGEPIATITSSSEGDPELWTPEELAEPARYVSKANVVRDQAGRGIRRHPPQLDLRRSGRGRRQGRPHRCLVDERTAPRALSKSRIPLRPYSARHRLWSTP
jgi:hypothetical protein